MGVRAVGNEEKLRAIAQEKRIEILKILMRKREKWASARELSENLGVRVSVLIYAWVLSQWS